tara:strand:- start:294 stop:509 length:216 start_codon:yes stop_codon:yes gene_type:complete
MPLASAKCLADIYADELSDDGWRGIFLMVVGNKEDQEASDKSVNHSALLAEMEPVMKGALSACRNEILPSN